MILATHRPAPRTTAPPPFFKVCGCGACYCEPAWQRLPYVGRIDSEDDHGNPCVAELRNCTCGSTISVAVPR